MYYKILSQYQCFFQRWSGQLFSLNTEVIEQAVGKRNTIIKVSTLFLCGIQCSLKSDSVEKQMENS